MPINLSDAHLKRLRAQSRRKEELPEPKPAPAPAYRPLVFDTDEEPQPRFPQPAPAPALEPEPAPAPAPARSSSPEPEVAPFTPTLLEQPKPLEAEDLVPKLPLLLDPSLKAIQEIAMIFDRARLAVAEVLKNAVTTKAITPDEDKVQYRWRCNNLDMTTSMAARFALASPAMLGALQLKNVASPGFFASLKSWMTGTNKYAKDWCGAPELFLQSLPAPAEVAAFAGCALQELVAFVNESKERVNGEIYSMCVLYDAAHIRPAALHRGNRQKLYLLFSMNTNLSASADSAALAIQARMFTADKDEERALPKPYFETKEEGLDLVLRYKRESTLNDAVFNNDAFVQLDGNLGVYNFQREALSGVTSEQLAEAIRIAFFNMLEGFVDTMSKQCHAAPLEGDSNSEARLEVAAVGTCFGATRESESESEESENESESESEESEYSEDESQNGEEDRVVGTGGAAEGVLIDF